MKELNNDDIQRMFEHELIKPDDTSPQAREDVDAYKMLFNALNQHPEVNIPHNFAVNVASAVKVKSKSYNLISYYVLLFFILIMSAFAVYVLLLAFNQAATIRISTILSPYKWMLLFALFMFLLIQYIDQKLIKDPRGAV
jgi:hypothetical protein